MAYIRLKADQSNTINSYYPNSNQGLNTVVEIYAKNIPDGRIKSRGLFHFDFSDFIDAYNNGIIPADFSTVTATYIFYNMYTDTTIPSPNVTYGLYLVNEMWDTGNGLDITTTGFSNWYKPKWNSVNWDGASITSRQIATCNCYNGDESLTADALPTLSGYFASFGPYNSDENYGLCVQLEDVYEFSTAYNYDIKTLFGYKTNSIFYPRIDIVWKDKFADDFKNLYFGSTGTIYFYNKQKGVYADLDGTNPFPGYFAITGSGINYALTGAASSVTGNIISGVSGSRVSTGIYKFQLPVIPYTYGNLTNNKAIWVITSSMSAVVASVSRPVTLHSPVNDESLDFNVKFKVSMVNFKERIEVGERFQWTIYFRKESDIITPLTAGSTAVNSYIATDGYWKIVDERTGVDVYPWQEMNYNDTINFINFDTKYLDAYRPYRLVLKINEGDRSYYFDTPDNYFVFNTY